MQAMGKIKDTEKSKPTPDETMISKKMKHGGRFPCRIYHKGETASKMGWKLDFMPLYGVYIMIGLSQ
jgi:hypothetical protein